MELITLLGPRAARADIYFESTTKRNDSASFQDTELVLATYGNVHQDVRTPSFEIDFMDYGRLKDPNILITIYCSVLVCAHGKQFTLES